MLQNDFVPFSETPTRSVALSRTLDQFSRQLVLLNTLTDAAVSNVTSLVLNPSETISRMGCRVIQYAWNLFRRKKKERK